MEHLLKLFIANHCLSCPDARTRVRQFAHANVEVVVVERNVDEERDAATGYGLIASPAIVIDGSAVLYGVPSLAQLARRCRTTAAAAESAPCPRRSDDELMSGRSMPGLQNVRRSVSRCSHA